MGLFVDFSLEQSVFRAVLFCAVSVSLLHNPNPGKTGTPTPIFLSVSALPCPSHIINIKTLLLHAQLLSYLVIYSSNFHLIRPTNDVTYLVSGNSAVRITSFLISACLNDKVEIMDTSMSVFNLTS